MGLLIAVSCEKDVAIEPYAPSSYDLQIPQGFPQMDIPANNPMTVEGIALGRKLFYDKRLSIDNSLACAGCHEASGGFSDPDQFSEGVYQQFGDRQAMACINLGYNVEFFWDGRSETLEDQVLQPVINPIEMHESWTNVVSKLSDDIEYRRMFYHAFGTSAIDSLLAAKAMAQFLRTMVSGNSRYDQFLRGEVALTGDELAGLNIFNTEIGDCFHCHGGIFFSSQDYHNNGLDETHTDLGRADHTNNPNDIGKFKAPTLRNIEYTAPYMHDGRFATLDDVINHYSTGVVWSPTIDPNMKKVNDGGLLLNPQQKAQLKAFLLTLSDPEFINNPDFQDPN